MFENLSGNQKKLITVGAPVVAAFALISVLQRDKQAVPVQTTVTGALPANLAPTTDAIGVGQLAEFESMLTGQIVQLANAVNSQGTELETQREAIKTQGTSVSSQITDLGKQIDVWASQAPAKAAVALPNVNSNWYPQIAPQGEDMSVIGSYSGQTYQGFNVKGGVPVYALIDGKWRQGFEMNKLAPGTAIAVPDTFAEYIDKSKTA